MRRVWPIFSTSDRTFCSSRSGSVGVEDRANGERGPVAAGRRRISRFASTQLDWSTEERIYLDLRKEKTIIVRAEKNLFPNTHFDK